MYNGRLEESYAWTNVRKWTNPLEELRTYEFTKEVTVYYGKVAGGKGYQIMIPIDVDPAEVLRCVGKTQLQ